MVEELKDLPEPTFSSLVLTLAASALECLGVSIDPKKEKTETNLVLAKRTIDTIQILKDKTKGNLDSEEEKLLDGLLSELKVEYFRRAQIETNPKS